MTTDMDVPNTFLLAPRLHSRLVDVIRAEGRSNLIPPQMSKAFFSSILARYRPHLRLLRQEQTKPKEMGLSANTKKGDKKVKSNIKAEGSLDGTTTDGDGEKKIAAHVLLTEAETKTNHIACEQERRASIRRGYELLCDLNPAWQEDGKDGEGSDDGMGIDDYEGDGDDDEIIKEQRRRWAGEDKIEGRARPRSEAAILMAAVHHLRGQLEFHRVLVTRKQEAQSRIAQKVGLDISIPPEASKG